MKLARKNHIANWGKGGSLSSFRNSPLILLLTFFLIFNLSFQQVSFARKGNIGDMSRTKAFTTGAISAGVTTIGVGVGGIPAAAGTIASTYTGVYCYSRGYSRDETAKRSILVGSAVGAGVSLVGGIIGGVSGAAAGGASGAAGGAAGGTAGGATTAGAVSVGDVVLNSGVNAGITFASSYTGGMVSYKLSKEGTHPALASAVGMLAGFGVGAGLSELASSAGVPGFAKPKSESPALPREVDTTTSPHSAPAIDSGYVSEDNPYLAPGMSAEYANTHTFPVSENPPSGSSLRIWGSLGKNLFSKSSLQQSANPWGRVAQMGIEKALITTVSRIAVSALVEAGVSEALGYDKDVRKKEDILKNQIASGLGSFAGSLAGNFAQGYINQAVYNEPYHPDIPQMLVSGAITAAAKIGFAYLNKGIDCPGLSGLTDIVAEALGSTLTDYFFRQDPGQAQRVVWEKYEFTNGKVGSFTGEEIWNSDLAQHLPLEGGRPRFKEIIDQGGEVYGIFQGYAYKRVEKLVSLQEQKLQVARQKAGFGELLAAHLDTNLREAASSSLPILGSSGRVGEYAWQEDGYSVQPVLNIINNAMSWSNFAQAVGRGISPCYVIAGNFDSNGYYVSASSLGSSITQAVLNPFRKPEERVYVGIVDGILANYTVRRDISGTFVDNPQDSNLLREIIGKYPHKESLPPEDVIEASWRAEEKGKGKWILGGQGLREIYRLYDFLFRPIAVKEYGTPPRLTINFQALKLKEFLGVIEIAKKSEQPEQIEAIINSIINWRKAASTPEERKWREDITWVPGESKEKKEKLIRIAELLSSSPTFILTQNIKLSDTVLSPRGRSIFTQYYGPKLVQTDAGPVWEIGKINKVTEYFYSLTPEGLEKAVARTVDKETYGSSRPISIRVTDITYFNPFTGTPLKREITKEYYGGPWLRAESEYHQALQALKELGILANVKGAYAQSALSPLLNLEKVEVKTEGPVSYIEGRGFVFLPSTRNISGYYKGEAILKRKNLYFYQYPLAENVFKTWKEKTFSNPITGKQELLLPETIRPVRIGGRVFFQDTGIDTLYNLRPIYEVTVTVSPPRTARRLPEEIDLPKGVGFDDGIRVPLQPSENIDK